MTRAHEIHTKNACYFTGNKYEMFLIHSQVSQKSGAYYEQGVTPKLALSPWCAIDKSFFLNYLV